MKEYFTVKGNSRESIEIKHSKFIASCCHVESREEASEFLAKICKEFSDATHNCYAYISDKNGMEVKFSDNGEPSGTAGQPILDAIQKSGLKEIIIVVTRYFGGIKLGASGLVGAYSSSAAAVLKSIQWVKMRPSVVLELTIPYSFGKKCDALPKNYDGIILNKEYTDIIKLTLSLPQEKVDDLKNAFLDLTKGQGIVNEIGEEYREILL